MIDTLAKVAPPGVAYGTALATNPVPSSSSSVIGMVLHYALPLLMTIASHYLTKLLTKKPNGNAQIIDSTQNTQSGN